jgi:hypothetical protein
MAFTDDQKVQIRKYAGYPAFGGVPIPNFGFRFFQAYGDLEFRLVNLAADEEAEVINNFLPKLTLLESDIYGVRDNSDTSQAAVWYRNKFELRERIANYTHWRKWLCNFIGCQIGPNILTDVGYRIMV